LADFSNKVLRIDLNGFCYAAAQHELVKWMPRGMELGAEN
jgi:hypothetical protein